MYSLGATMCFLLTGAAPLAASGMKARFRIRRLPELRRAPKPLHNLLVHLLRENPENRPQDPVALEKEMRECLTKIERRQAIGRKLGLPLAAVIPRKAKELKQSTSPMAQVLGGFAAVAVLLLGGAAVAEYFFPDKIPYFRRREKKIGVQIGVPDAAKFATTPSQAAGAAPITENQPTPSTSPAVATTKENSPPAAAQQDQASKSQDTNSVTNPQTIWNQLASAQKSEPAAPGSGSSEPPTASTPQSSEQSSSAESNQSTGSSKRKIVSSSRRSTSPSSRGPIPRYDDYYGRERSYSGRHRAEVVGRTPDGGLIVRLSSGRVVVLPRLNDGDIYAPRPRHRGYRERPDDFIPPSQPFSPDYY